MEPSQNLHHSPIILGRPFLAIANANINCKSGLMDISFGDQKVTLNVFRTSKTLREEEDCCIVDMIDGLTEDSLVNKEVVEYNDNPLEESWVDPGTVQPSESQTIWSTKVEPLSDLDLGPDSPTTQTPPQWELKMLPRTLKYVFLGPKETLPVIIFAELTPTQEASLIEVL